MSLDTSVDMDRRCIVQFKSSDKLASTILDTIVYVITRIAEVLEIRKSDTE